MFAECSSKLLLLPILLASFTVITVAQDQKPTPQPTPLTAPPPLHTITKEERTQMSDSTEPKQRVRVTIEFAQTHLTTAERYTSESNFEAASHQIGSYRALIQDLLTFLATLKRDNNKTRDLYKRLELALRADGPRLTAMRRTTPLEFAVWIKQVEDFAREGRTEALNSFYGHNVVHDDESKPAEKPTEKPLENSTPKSKQR
jgi:hypothetical protein